MSHSKDVVTTQATSTKPIKNEKHLILVIDDEETVREAVVDIMELQGIEVVTAENGATGVAQFNKHRAEIQLVLLDMSMPGLNGVETLKRLRQINPQLPIILSSGYAEQHLAKEINSNNFTGFLPKPYDVSTLINKVWQYLPGK